MTQSRRTCLIGVVVAMVVCVAAAWACVQSGGFSEYSQEEWEATTQAVEALTSVHGAEARSAVVNYVENWASLEAHRNPEVRAAVATGQFLDYFRFPAEPEPGTPYWLVTTSVTVGQVQVLAYSPQRLKVVACVAEEIDKVTTEGVFLESLPTHKSRGVYAFVYEDDGWKVAGFFDVTDLKASLRDWDYASEWLKTAVGDLPRWESCDW